MTKDEARALCKDIICLTDDAYEVANDIVDEIIGLENYFMDFGEINLDGELVSIRKNVSALQKAIDNLETKVESYPQEKSKTFSIVYLVESEERKNEMS